MSVEVSRKYRAFCPKCLDFHAHFLHPEVFAAGHPHSVSSCFGRHAVPASAPLLQRFFTPELQIEDMEAHGIDMQVLSSADVIQSRTLLSLDEQVRLAAMVNDECVRWIDRFPDRFIGSAVLPLGDMKRALSELERAITAGLKIVELPSNYRGAYLGDTYFTDLWSAFLQHDVIAFIHPEGTEDPWFQSYAMWNSIGQSIEEVKVMSSLIYEGVLDRCSGLKIVMAHGGGYMPHYMGRLDRNVTDKPFSARNIRKKPSEYLSDFYYDSCVYDPRTLELLIERVGIDRIVLGGDYPASLLDPLDFLESARLTDADRGRIAGGNALTLLGLTSG